MDINKEKLFSCKGDPKHEGWERLYQEAKRKKEKHDIKYFFPKTEISNLFGEQKNSPIELVSDLKKLTNFYLCLHRYAVNFIHKSDEKNLEVIKVIKMYTGYWVSNFQDSSKMKMEQKAIHVLRFLGYEVNDNIKDQLMLNTKAELSVEPAKTAVDLFLSYVFCRYVSEIIEKVIITFKYSVAVAREVLFKITEGIFIDPHDLKKICEICLFQIEKSPEVDNFNIQQPQDVHASSSDPRPPKQTNPQQYTAQLVSNKHAEPRPSIGLYDQHQENDEPPQHSPLYQTPLNQHSYPNPYLPQNRGQHIFYTNTNQHDQHYQHPNNGNQQQNYGNQQRPPYPSSYKHSHPGQLSDEPPQEQVMRSDAHDSHDALYGDDEMENCQEVDHQVQKQENRQEVEHRVQKQENPNQPTQPTHSTHPTPMPRPCTNSYGNVAKNSSNQNTIYGTNDIDAQTNSEYVV